MPQTEVVFFKDIDGSVPALVWMDDQLEKVQDKLIVRIERLEELGHELRRPEADYLRDDIYELRVKNFKVNYRILYFFCQQKAVLSHGLTKEDVVPPKEIDRAIENLKKYSKDPAKHTYEE